MSKKENKHKPHNGHTHPETNNKKALTISFALITTYMLVEFIGGLLTDSLALLSDAGHMLSDSAALGLSLFALIFGTKEATISKSYGYKRFEILAALLNGLALILISIFICKEAFERLSDPPQIIGKGMMIISIIGLFINIIVAWILHTQGSVEENLNIKSAFLHVISDLLGSIGAIIAAVLIVFFGWNIADPIASILVSILVLYSGWRIISDSINILMEGTPKNIDVENVRKTIEKIEDVIEVHDLHIWMITPEYVVLTAHLQVAPDANRDLILEKAKNIITEKYAIKHITLQIEGPKVCTLNNSCN